MTDNDERFSDTPTMRPSTKVLVVQNRNNEQLWDVVKGTFPPVTMASGLTLGAARAEAVRVRAELGQ